MNHRASVVLRQVSDDSCRPVNLSASRHYTTVSSVAKGETVRPEAADAEVISFACLDK